jgi:Dyp-type peroxidase family
MEFSDGLKQIQGNVIGFNKPCQHFLLLHFNRPEFARAWLDSILGEVTTAQDVVKFREDRRKHREGLLVEGPKEVPWLNIAFTYAGLEMLSQPFPEKFFPQEFVEGMAKRADALGDVGQSAPDKWVFPEKGAEKVHALLILAADNSDALRAEVMKRCGEFKPEDFDIAVVGEQCCQVVRDANKHSQDHFGFREGVSQPGFRGEGLDESLREGGDLVLPGEFVLGYPRQDPNDAAAKSPDGVPSPKWARNGSYLVVRRLRQDVDAFKNFVGDPANRHGLSEELFMAKLVGRYKSGAPLADQKLPGPGAMADPGVAPNQNLNNFGYQEDPEGELVPRGAHIRRLNPRDQAGLGRARVQTRRILRRGIPFEERPEDGGERGMLFVCYQRSIADQYEFLQQSWANDPYFPAPGKGNIRPGRDPFIGQGRATVSGPPKYNIPGTVDSDGNAVDHVTLMKWITMTGGGYFFSPSKDAIGQLAEGRRLDEVERAMEDNIAPEDGQEAIARVLGEAADAARRQKGAASTLAEARSTLAEASKTARQLASSIEKGRLLKISERRRNVAAGMQKKARGDIKLLKVANRELGKAEAEKRSALGLDAKPVPKHANPIKGFGDCKLQITVAFDGLDGRFYYPWRVWVRGEPIWTSQPGEYLVPNDRGFATGTMWLRILRILEALDPDLTAGQIVQSRQNPESLDEVLGAYAEWEVELITRADTGDGTIAAIPRSAPDARTFSPFQEQGSALDWTAERIGEFFPIDVGIWPG